MTANCPFQMVILGCKGFVLLGHSHKKPAVLTNLYSTVT